ncbi:MAG: 4-aminobutyrate--2-oxoglutarate transaminase [Planctomycetota bacterium]|nr:4-aminobutyrate--2-oxoglutarate transaminase [Planctomycetota bacterium]
MRTPVSTTQELLDRRAAAIPKGPFNVAPIFVDHAEGAYVWDIDGNRYLDFCSGISTLNVGHNHPRIVEAVKAQADRLIHACWHVAMYEPYVHLAERLNDLVPIEEPCKTALFNSGAEAVENAVKIARLFTGRPAVVAFERAFHGRTLLGMSMTGKVAPYSAGFGPFAPEVYRLPYRPFFDQPGDRTDEQVAADCTRTVADLFKYQIDADSVACITMEPVLGEGGFFPAHPAAVRTLREICNEHGIVFIADEVQSGLGRCGAMFACERYGVEPDLITMAKSLAGGMPLSAVTGRAEIMDAPHVGGIGGTFGGNPVACAAAHAVLDVLQGDGFFEHAQAIGDRVMPALKRLADQYPHISSVRGLGAMCAFELTDPVTGAPNTAATNGIIRRARERGLLLMSASGNVIRLLMPLIITMEQLDEALTILADSVADELSTT